MGLIASLCPPTVSQSFLSLGFHSLTRHESVILTNESVRSVNLAGEESSRTLKECAIKNYKVNNVNIFSNSKTEITLNYYLLVLYSNLHIFTYYKYVTV